MRRFLMAATFALAPVMAWADQSISGQWQAILGHDVTVAMDVLADGYWSSQTIQSNKVVAEMAGTYEQKRDSNTVGTLVFTPVKSKNSPEHGPAQVETDKYTLERNGSLLRLVSSNADTMEFQKQPYRH